MTKCVIFKKTCRILIRRMYYNRFIIWAKFEAELFFGKFQIHEVSKMFACLTKYNYQFNYMV